MDIFPTAVDIFLNNLPVLIAAIFLGRAFFFFGQDDVDKKNNLSFVALAFFLFAIQKISVIGFWIYASNTHQEDLFLTVSDLLQIVFVPTVAMFLIVGGIAYSRMFGWIRSWVAVMFGVLVWYGAVRPLLLPSFEWQQYLMNIYMVSGFVLLGAILMIVRKTKRHISLKLTGFFIFLIGGYYFQAVMPNGLNRWWLETVLFVLPSLCLYRAANIQMKNQLKFLSDELERTKQRIPQMIQASPFPIMISRLKDDRLVLVNDKALKLFNINAPSLQIFKSEQFYVNPEARLKFTKLLTENHFVDSFEAEFKKQDSTGHFWLEVSARIMEFENEPVLYSAFKDITDQKKREHELFEKAVLDPLTGCYNRRQFVELANKEIRRSWRYDAPFCLLMLDIDHFKAVNDTYGHAAGDEVLKAVAKMAKVTLRDSDVFARFGGEEFIALLPHTDLVGASVVAERIRKNVQELQILAEGQNIQCTISMGVASSEVSEDLDTLIKATDEALYTAKECGRNQVRFYGERKPSEVKDVPVLPEVSEK